MSLRDKLKEEKLDDNFIVHGAVSEIRFLCL